MMHAVRRRAYAVLSVFAAQQVSGGKRNPIGSAIEALEHDWNGVRKLYSCDPDVDACPPCTPRARSESDEVNAELDVTTRSRQADHDDDEIAEAEVKLPARWSFARRSPVRTRRCERQLTRVRAAVDAWIREFMLQDSSRQGGRQDGPPGKKRRTEFGPSDSDQSTGPANGEFAMPSKAEVEGLATRGNGPAPSEEAMCQSD